MYSGVSWLNDAAAMQNLLHYFGDKNHRDHRDKIIGQVIEHGIPDDSTPLQMFLSHIAKCAAKNRQIRRGRKIKRKIQHTIDRTPDGAWLTEEETIWFQNKITSRMEWGFSLSVSHSDKYTGATDFHFMSPYRKGRSNPISTLRAVSDEIHAELNQMRREKHMPRIETMPEVRHRKKKEAGIKSLTEQLAAVDGLSTDTLQASIENLGHAVTRHNKEKGTISVIHQGKKKAHRYSIDSLLGEANALRALKILSLPVVDGTTPDLDMS